MTLTHLIPHRIPLLFLPLCSLVLLLLPLQVVHSFPTGAGGCQGGMAAVGGAHIEGPRRILDGPLEEGGFAVTLGNVLLNPGMNSSDTVFDINTNYELLVKGTRFAYKGCLIRLEVVNDQTVLGVLLPKNNTGLAFACLGFSGVAGITHTEASFKEELSGTVNMAQAGDVKLDITVVGVNNETVSLYAYDGFVVSFAAPPPTPTLTPTKAPITKAPATAAPTVEDTKAPAVATGEPTMAPATAAPTTMAPATAAPTTKAPATATPTMKAPVTPIFFGTPSMAPSDVSAVTAAPIPAPTVNEAPSDVSAVTAAPIPAPTVNEAPIPIPPSTPVDQMMVQNMVITFAGVTTLSVAQTNKWESLTEKWFMEFYNGDDERRRLQTLSDNYGVALGSMKTTITVTSSAVEEESGGDQLVVTYDQEMSYGALDSALGPLQYTTLPFRSTSAKAKYEEQLKNEITAFGNLVTIPVPKIQGPEKVEESDGLSVGAIAGIAIAIFVVIAGAAFGVYRYNSISAANRQPDGVMAQEFDKDAFSFGAGDASSPHASKKGIDASRSGGGSVANAESAAGGVAAAETATLITRSSDSENEYVVYAPSGKLGIVLDSPDDKGPVVYIIKENSPLMDRIEVGDRLVAVDEVDVRAMSPTKVSKLISKRSGNPIRKFTLVRNLSLAASASRDSHSLVASESRESQSLAASESRESWSSQ